MTREDRIKSILSEIEYGFISFDNLNGCDENGNFYQGLDIIKEALEKQLPKKQKGRSVRYGIDEEYSVEYRCTKCNCYVGDEYENYKYCCNCGQAIDWSEVE